MRFPAYVLSCAAFSFVLGSFGNGQQQSPPYFPWQGVELVESNTIDWPPQVGGAGPFQRVVIGRITGHDELSAVVLKGGIATLVYRPTHFTALSNISADSFTDVAISQDPDPEDQDGILLVGGDGLVRMEFDPATQTFEDELLADGPWVGAARVLGLGLNGSPDGGVLGLDSDRDTALILEWEEGNGVLGENQFPLGGVTHYITAMDWNDNGQLEIIAYQDARVKVFDLAGTQIDSVRVVQPGGTLAALPARTGPDHLALVQRNPADTRFWFYTFNSSGYDGPMSLLFSPPGGGAAADIDLFDLVPGDWDGDGDLDVLLAHETYHQAIALENLGSAIAPSFDVQAGGYETFDLSPTPGLSASGNRAVPACGDLDRDPLGAADMIFALDSTNGLVVEVSQPQNTSSAVLGSGPEWEFLDGTSLYTQSPADGLLELRLNSIPTWLVDNFAYLQVTIWAQADPVTSSTPPETQWVALSNEVHPLTDDTASPGNHTVPIAIPHVGDPCPSGSGYLWLDREHLYLKLRFVNAVPWTGGAYKVYESAYPLVLGMTLPGDESEKGTVLPGNPAFVYLEANGVEVGGGAVIIQLQDNGGTPDPNPLPPNASVGAIVPQNSVPPFEVPGIPDPTPPTLGTSTVIWFPI